MPDVTCTCFLFSVIARDFSTTTMDSFWPLGYRYEAPQVCAAMMRANFVRLLIAVFAAKACDAGKRGAKNKIGRMYDASGLSENLVAGTGMEPVTFGL